MSEPLRPRQSGVITANEHIGQDAAVAILEMKAEADRLRKAGDALHDVMEGTLTELGWSDDEAAAERAAMKEWRDA